MKLRCELFALLALAAGVAALRADDFLSNGVKICYEIARQGESGRRL